MARVLRDKQWGVGYELASVPLEDMEALVIWVQPWKCWSMWCTCVGNVIFRLVGRVDDAGCLDVKLVLDIYIVFSSSKSSKNGSCDCCVGSGDVYGGLGMI